ncbi:MAG: radical SAM protein [Candidatus Magnetomorum sp.]|nr:radical SAM protein [Candidatus Magnetomorum sp.]
MRKNKPKNIQYIQPLVADTTGEIFELDGYAAVGRMGPVDVDILSLENTIPMPYGSEIMFLPDRSPIVYNPMTNAVEEIVENPYEPGTPLFPVSVFCSPGYILSHLSAFEADEHVPPLPLFSYGAVGWYQNGFRVSAIQVDWERRQDLRLMSLSKVHQGVKHLQKIMPNNRLRKHLEHCALVYGCPAAKNFFIGRCEAPLPTSTSCNARCLGCLSLQKNSSIHCSQDRISFTPEPDEISEIAIQHIKTVDHSVVSFGQGCEGEPLLAAHAIGPAIEKIRQKTTQGTINLNTNASCPDLMKHLFDVGLDSIRVSINSLQPKAYDIYFRPINYSFDDVIKSIEMALSLDKHVALNYLNCPGFTDLPKEIQALEQFLNQYPIHLIQWRNLNIDPLWYYSQMFDTNTETPVGIAPLLKHLKTKYPSLRFGYFNPPKETFAHHA